MANNRFPILEYLPYTLLFEILQYLSPSEKAIVAMTCTTTLNHFKSLDQNGHFDHTHGIDFRNIMTHAFFNSRLFTIQKNTKQAALYILRGKKDEALAMIDQDNSLLLQVLPSVTLKKHASHVGDTFVNCKLFQLALSTYDHELYNAIGQRLESMYGHDEKAKQFNEQFPNGVKSTKRYRAVFDTLIKTIASDTTIDFVNGQNIMNEETKAELQAFKYSMMQTQMPFDLQIVVDVIEAYEKANNDNDMTVLQREFYLRCVFGLIEKFVPYYVAMALSEEDDFFDVMEGNKKVTRSTLLADSSDFFDNRLGESRYIIAGTPRTVGGVREGLGGVARAKSMISEMRRRERISMAALKTFVQLTQKHLDSLNDECYNQKTNTITM